MTVVKWVGSMVEMTAERMVEMKVEMMVGKLVDK